VNAGVEAIGLEEGQVLIKCACLETMDRGGCRIGLKRRGVPARVSRRAIWMDMRDAGVWQRDLVKTLKMPKNQCRSRPSEAWHISVISVLLLRSLRGNPVTRAGQMWE
jgi:hypothetical protein